MICNDSASLADTGARVDTQPMADIISVDVDGSIVLRVLQWTAHAERIRRGSDHRLRFRQRKGVRVIVQRNRLAVARFIAAASYAVLRDQQHLLIVVHMPKEG